VTRRRSSFIPIAIGLLSAALVAGQTAAAEPDHVTVVASGLDNPRGIDIGANGRIVVAETGAGRVIRVSTTGAVKTLIGGFPVEVSPEGEASGVHGVALTGNGNLFTVVGESADLDAAKFWTLYRKNGNGKLRQVVDIQAHQATDPDPTDSDMPPFPTQSNPYGLESVGGSRILVTDAGNNDLLLVDARGRVKTVARFPTEMVATDHLPFPFPAPEVPAEAVPTTVAIGPDGYWYVGELKGFPFRPGSSNIWRIAPWARGATCDANTDDGCSLWKTGFTAIVGIEFAPDGSLYVAEMVKNGLFAFFFGGDTVGELLHVVGSSRTPIAAGQLHVPGDVAVSRTGKVYVTVGSVFPNGAVVRVGP